MQSTQMRRIGFALKSNVQPVVQISHREDTIMPSKQTTQADVFGMPKSFLETTQDNPLLFIARLQADAYKAMLKWQIESLGFLRHRYEQDVKLIDELIASPEPGEMLSTYSRFLHNALDEYSKETVKTANYGSKVASDTARGIRAEAEKISGDIMAATTA